MQPAQLPVRRPAHLETTSLGAAYAAGIGSGFWTREWVLGADLQQGDVIEFLPKARGPICMACDLSSRNSPGMGWSFSPDS